MQNVLSKGGAVENLKLWCINKEHLDHVWEKGSVMKGQSIDMYPTLLDWCTVFLAQDSISMNTEVRCVMKFPSISYIYKQTAEMISIMRDEAYSVNIDTICKMGTCAGKEGRSSTQLTGMLTQDSANISPSIEHVYVRWHIVGGDKSH